MDIKKLIIVAECTAAMEPFWKAIVDDYLSKIVRKFCGNESLWQDSPEAIAELGLIYYHGHGPHSAGKAAHSGWTRDVNIYMDWLSNLKFDNGDLQKSAIAEGLADALAMFLMDPEGFQEQLLFVGKRHCILVAATDPFSTAKVAETENSSGEISGFVAEQEATDAESFAKLFPQFTVSLSVISPRQLPLLRKIYDAGNGDLTAYDPSINNAKNPDFLVLLSQRFQEAHSALNEYEAADPELHLSEEDLVLLEQLLAGPSISSNADEIIHTDTMEEEATSAAFTEQQPEVVQHDPFLQQHNFPQCFSMDIPSAETYADNFTSQEMFALENTNVPSAIVLSQTAQPLHSIVNPSIVISSHSQPSQASCSLAETGTASEGLSTYQRNHDTTWLSSESYTGNSHYPQNPNCCLFLNSNDFSGNLMNAKPVGLQSMGNRKQFHNLVQPTVLSEAFALNCPSSQSITSNILASAVSDASGNLRTPLVRGFQTMQPLLQGPQGGSRIPRQLANFQRPVGVDYLQPRVSKRAHMELAGVVHRYNPMSSTRQSTFESVEQAGFGYQWNPMSSAPQSTVSSRESTTAPFVDEGMDSANVARCHLNEIRQGQEGVVRTWEGAISALIGGEPITICGAVAYRMTSTSCMIASDWPETLQMGRLLCQDFFEKFPKMGPKDSLIIEVTNHHSVLEHLKTRKLCSNVKLPSQTMIFSPTYKDRYFLATIFPGEYHIYRSKLPASLHQPQKHSVEQQNDQTRKQGEKTRKS